MSILDGEVPGKVINLDSVIGFKSYNRIAHIGVELEGAWKKPPATVDRDSSVFKSGKPGDDDGGVGRPISWPGYLVGEIQLGPIMPINLKAELEKYWPDQVDGGLHIHMSFHTLWPYLLLTDYPDYQETMVEYLRRWAKKNNLPASNPLWDRLDNKSIYCQKKFWPQAQMNFNGKDHDQHRYGHRYTMIHYCFQRYQTVECRLLPMFNNINLAYSGLMEIIDITNAYLVKTDKSRRKEIVKVEGAESGTSVELVFAGGQTYEEHIED